MIKWLKRLGVSLRASLFAQHRLCWWCEMPMPDCTCPISRLKAANDNRKQSFLNLTGSNQKRFISLRGLTTQ